MYQPLWQLFRPVVAKPEPAEVAVPGLPVTPQNVLDHDRAYVNAHPELYTFDSSRFHYDRAPLPSEWSEELPGGCYVRVYVINAWSIVRVLHSAEGTRLKPPVIDAWVSDLAA